MVDESVNHEKDAKYGSWFHLSFDHFMAPFLWSMRVQTMKNLVHVLSSSRKSWINFLKFPSPSVKMTIVNSFNAVI